jgi:glycosyltransferase involved in cell wall biosynthesis
MNGHDKPFFTVFIPTFNRAHTLGRALQSVAEQSFRDFEVLVVDDGSTDETARLVESWQQAADFPIIYHRQENQGKHGAHNTALGLATGELMVVLDSDDRLAPDALTILKRHWDAIPDSDKPAFAGVEGLCAFMDSGKVAGSRYPQDLMDSNYIQIRKTYQVGGDKKNAIRTAVMREFPYPRFDGEHHIRPSLLFKRIAQKYKMRYVNEVIQLIEYQSDGLSSNRFELRMRNPQGFACYFREEVNIFSRADRFYERFAACRKFVRYCLHAGTAVSDQYDQIEPKALYLMALPFGYLDAIRDRLRMRTGNRKARR